MNVTVIGGAGYVGLTTSACLAYKGNNVYCVDIDQARIKTINEGSSPIHEAGLEEILEAVVKEGRLFATRDAGSSISASSAVFICAGTPSNKDGSIDLRQVVSATRNVGRSLSKKDEYCVVVVKSTVVPGTTRSEIIPLLEKVSKKKAGIDFGVCMNPEFLREGSAVKDLLFPRDLGIVIGQFDEKSGDSLLELYRGFDAEIFRTTIDAAEMIKYARNAYLSKDISFANEMANICQKLGVDYLDVKKGLEMDSRIGRFLNAGIGFGGSCFPKDVRALIAKAKEAGIEPRILEATLRVNESQPDVLMNIVKRALGNIKNKNFAVLGLAFKLGTNDMREAKSIPVIERLLAQGAHVYAFDPKATGEAKKIFGSKIHYTATAEEALQKADACIIATEWPKFSNPKLYDHLKGRFIFDGRRSANPRKVSSRLVYYGIGFPEGIKF
jgi:UDPglucose 6-dehydrogenase